jgi:hypothetical protein
MAEGFLKGLRGRVLFWSAWVFTVGGAAVGLLLAREYWWLLVLALLSVLLALGFYAHSLHRRLGEAERRHTAERSRLQGELQETTLRLRDAGRSLNEIPARQLAQLEGTLAEVIAAHAHAELARVVAAHAEFVERMRTFATAQVRPMTPRTFVRRAGRLYAVAKARSEALPFVRPGDLFLLIRDTDGLQTESARLIVNQEPDRAHETVYFCVETFLSDEMGHLDSLAQSQEVAGLKGYSIRPCCDVDRFREVNLRSVADAIRPLVEDFGRHRRA